MEQSDVPDKAGQMELEVLQEADKRKDVSQSGRSPLSRTWISINIAPN